jgi:hypothetical protein
LTTKIPTVELESIPKIAATDLHLLWVNDWDDGPLEAVVEHRGQACLMILHDEDETRAEEYRWLLLELTEEQLADERKWHALFAENVGQHWCFHGPSIVHPPPPQNPDPEAFYRPYRERPPLDLTRSPVLGWSDEMPPR